MSVSFNTTLPSSSRLLELDPVELLVALVVRGHDAIAGLEARQDLDLFAVAPAELDAAAVGVVAVGRDHEHVVAARTLKEGARRQHQRGLVAAQRQAALYRGPGGQ